MTTRPKILLVDDVPENLVALAALLRWSEVEILTAGSGREALELLLVHDVALALLDVQMPEIDGFELAELMRGLERTRNVPIIFVTAGARDPAHVFAGYDAGAVDFLFKPIDPIVLTSKVRVFVTLHQQRLELSQKVGELREALHTNELFVAILGHDLRAPLAVVDMTAELWQRRDDPASRRAAERLLAASNRMSRMIGDLLDVARARRGAGIPVNVARVDLGVVVGATLGEMEASAKKTPLQLRTLGDVCGSWDGDRIAQVVTNFVANALQHGERGAPIVVELDGLEAERLHLRVISSGALPTAGQEHLFDPFISGNPQSGLGLGLYIVKLIADAHGGSVRAHSADGKATFELTLPRAVEAERASA